MRLAAARIELRQHARAFEILEGALESRAVLCLRANCLRSLDRVDEARQYLDQGIKQFVDDPDRSLEEDMVYQEARRLKGTMLIEDKKFGEARAVLEVLCKEYPFDAKSLYKLVQAYRGLGLEKEAAEALKLYEPLRAKRERFSNLHVEAVSQPDNADTRYELGSLALELGEGKLAIAWFNAALAIDPDPTKAIIVLATYLAVNLTLGSFIEPRILGRELNLSPLVVVISVVVWAGIWGVVGGFLAVPLTAALQYAPANTRSTASAASAALAAVAGHSGTGFHECQYRQPSERHPSPHRQGCWAYDARRISHWALPGWRLRQRLP